MISSAADIGQDLATRYSAGQGILRQAGRMLNRDRAFEDARSLYAEAVNVGRELIHACPGNATFCDFLAAAECGFAKALCELGRSAEAEEWFDRAIERRRPLLGWSPKRMPAALADTIHFRTWYLHGRIGKRTRKVLEGYEESFKFYMQAIKQGYVVQVPDRLLGVAGEYAACLRAVGKAAKAREVCERVQKLAHAGRLEGCSRSRLARLREEKHETAHADKSREAMRRAAYILVVFLAYVYFAIGVARLIDYFAPPWGREATILLLLVPTACRWGQRDGTRWGILTGILAAIFAVLYLGSFWS
jgi:tetratricopeptide (TPR) repeat protein